MEEIDAAVALAALPIEAPIAMKVSAIVLPSRNLV